MFTALLITIHVLVCIAIIIIVLLQAGKGAEVGASFGTGGSGAIMGATTSKSFMSRLTTMTAIIFMLTSLTLAYFYGRPGDDSIMPAQAVTAPASEAPAPAPAAPAPAEQSK